MLEIELINEELVEVYNEKNELKKNEKILENIIFK